ncbi:MAG TPA: hypothetical protein PK528_13205 [Syntrophorhabdus sp.]|nr:hypothetical protein [Syntrophorhabdus sp.]
MITAHNESAKMLTSHGAIKGYNSQALVDAKIRQLSMRGIRQRSGSWSCDSDAGWCRE